jgi:hypothetical protein
VRPDELLVGEPKLLEEETTCPQPLDLKQRKKRRKLARGAKVVAVFLTRPQQLFRVKTVKH